MQLGFVMQTDAAPHDDRRFWPDVVDRHRGRRPLRRHLVSFDVGHLFRLGRFLELARLLEMSWARAAPVAARLEKMRIRKILPSVITSLQQAGAHLGRTPAHPATPREAMLHLRNAVLPVLFKVNQCVLNPNPPRWGTDWRSVTLGPSVSLLVVRRRDDRRYNRLGENMHRRSHVHVIRRRTFGVTLPRLLSIEMAGRYPQSSA